MKRTVLFVVLLLIALGGANKVNAALSIPSIEESANDAYLKASAEAARNGQVVMWMGPGISLPTGLALVDQWPIKFDPQDVGKPFDEIQNEETRADLVRAYERMYRKIGTEANARRIANGLLNSFNSHAKADNLPEGPATQAEFLKATVALSDPDARRRAVDEFVADFKRMEEAGFILSARMPIYDDPPSCGLGEVCPGVCGTKMPGGPGWWCPYACVSCGNIK